MPNNTYELGELVKVTVEFTDEDTGNVIDPDAVKLSVRSPANVTTTYTYGVGAVIVRDSQGNYHANIDTTQLPGAWYYRWWSTGNGQTAREKRFDVRAATAI